VYIVGKLTAMEYRDHLAECDKVLPTFLNTNFIARDGSQVIEVSLDPHTIAIDQLLADGFLIERKNRPRIYDLTAHGRDFIRRGGYKARFEEEEKIKALNEKQIESVIDTNKSVKQTNKFQIGSLITTGVIIIASCVFQGLSYIEQKSENQLLKEHLKSDSIKEMSIKNQLLWMQKQIDSMQYVKKTYNND
jgi:hypothetical protein